MIKKKLILQISILVVLAILLANIDGYKHINYSTYLQDMLRFEMSLTGDCRVIPLNVLIDLSNDYSMDELFFKKSANISFKSETIKYGQYLLSNNSEYIFAKINNEYSWIEHPIPLKSSVKKYIQQIVYSTNNSYTDTVIIPFNDPKYILVISTESFILNLDSYKITWKSNLYYEGVKINFFMDTLECTVDLSNKKYIFTKEGKIYDNKKF